MYFFFAKSGGDIVIYTPATDGTDRGRFFSGKAANYFFTEKHECR